MCKFLIYNNLSDISPFCNILVIKCIKNFTELLELGMIINKSVRKFSIFTFSHSLIFKFSH